MDWEASFSLSETTRQRALRSSRLRNRSLPLHLPMASLRNASSLESSISSQPSTSQRRKLSRKLSKPHDDNDNDGGRGAGDDDDAERLIASSFPKKKPPPKRRPHPTNMHSGNGDANDDVCVTTSISRRSILAPCQRSQKRNKGQMETIDAVLDDGKLPALLGAEFFQCDALELAPKLLGKLLRRDEVVLQITEVEAYRPNDSACHGRFGVTPRTAPVFGPGGHAYVYLCYGLHIMLNIVADIKGVGAAVLIRSCAPVAGMTTIQSRRGIMSNKPVLLTGPGKVGQALGLTTEWSNHPLYMAGGLEVLDGPALENVLVGPRVGIDNANPEDVAALWRFAKAETPWISAPRNTLTPLRNSA